MVKARQSSMEVNIIMGGLKIVNSTVAAKVFYIAKNKRKLSTLLLKKILNMALDLF